MDTRARETPARAATSSIVGRLVRPSAKDPSQGASRALERASR